MTHAVIDCTVLARLQSYLALSVHNFIASSSPALLKPRSHTSIISKMGRTLEELRQSSVIDPEYKAVSFPTPIHTMEAHCPGN